MLRILFAVGALCLVLFLLLGPVAEAQASPDYCLAPWQWNDQDPVAPFWEAPFPSINNGTLDMRSIPQQGTAGGVGMWGFFAYSESPPLPWPLGMECYGSDLAQPLTQLAQDTALIKLGVSIRAVPRGQSLTGLIRDLYILHGDPSGVDRWKPLRGYPDTGAQLFFGGRRLVDEKVDQAHPAFANTLAVRVADYRRHKARGTSLAVLQRWTGHDGLALFGRDPTDADLDLLLPTEYRADSWLRPQTTITESFDQVDSTTLGPDLTWAEVSGAWETHSNAAKNEAATSGVQITARAESDLSSDDHYVQANLTITVNLAGAFIGLCARFADAADTCYFGGFDRASDLADEFVIFKIVTGTPTELFRTSDVGAAAHTGLLGRLEVTGSSLDFIFNAISRVSGTDTAITGNLRTGMTMRANGARRNVIDNFEAGDLATPPPPPSGDSQIIIID